MLVKNILWKLELLIIQLGFYGHLAILAYLKTLTSCAFSFFIFGQQATFHSINTFLFNRHIFIKQTHFPHFHQIDTFSINRYLLVYQILRFMTFQQTPFDIYITNNFINTYILHKLNQICNLLFLILSHKKLLINKITFFSFA